MNKEWIYILGLVAECVLCALMSKSFFAENRVANHKYVPVNLIIMALSVAMIIVTADDKMSHRSYIIMCLMLAVINISAFAAHEIFVLRNKELQKMIDERAQLDKELESYKLMYKKYEKTRMLRHDLKEQLATLKSLIGKNDAEAMQFADRLGKLGHELDFVEYTDNKVLNILLDRKVSECHDKGIELYVKSNGVSMKFINELDTVAIFSNLINNAMESCVQSREKNIFIDFSTLNNSFVVVKVENNCDVPPRSENNLPVTSKADAQLHGIGMKSIKAAVEEYNGDMTWKYDKNFFTVVLLFNKSENG